MMQSYINYCLKQIFFSDCFGGVILILGNFLIMLILYCLYV